MLLMAFVATWNIHDEDENYFDLETRTNNALERYNRSMNDKFPTPYTSLPVVVQTIKLESYKQVKKCENICRGINQVPRIKETNIGLIPFCYSTFQIVNL